MAGALRRFLQYLSSLPETLGRKLTRLSSLSKMIKGKKNLVACQNCGHMHELHTVCGYCYAKVREETKLIKEQLASESHRHVIDREKVVLYEGEALSSEQQGTEKHTVQLNRPRPEWISEELKKRWHRPVEAVAVNVAKEKETVKTD